MKLAHPLDGLYLLIVIATVIMTAPSDARADGHQNKDGNIAALSPGAIVPVIQRALVARAIKVTGKCDGRVMVFKFTNSGLRWTARGSIAVRNGANARLLVRRQLRFGVNQSASFRVQPQMNTTGRFLVDIRQPDGRGVRRIYAGVCRGGRKTN